MFSGLVEAKASVQALEPEPGGVRLTISRPAQFDDISLGDSIAISGCCLTVVKFSETSMEFQAGEETLSKTKLGQLSVASEVNCERSLALGDRLGGHLVTGHVDGLGTLSHRGDNAEWSDLEFSAPEPLCKQMASKGSITVDGVSLTLVKVTDSLFSVALIPHTLAETTLGELKVGDSVNLETDLLAKYVARQLNAFTP
ncbi:MAG TPA: riboflavin synthase [Planctomycetaceae bacterium]|nr:riboflavin synthase [Planctomycetaceae bacterium]